MKINRIEDVHPPTPDTEVAVKICGNIAEVRYMRRTPDGCPIQKLSDKLYLDIRPGEVKEIQSSDNRSEDLASVAQSLKRLRDLINANLTDPEMALWVTLTYAENMRDAEKLYEDYRRFWQRFKYYAAKEELPPVEYIIAAEPQARGAWHLHALFLFDGKAPYISNDTISQIWGHGFTKTKSLKGIGNPGLYLTAYLGDMEFTEAVTSGMKRGRLAEVEAKDEQGLKQKKAVIKGARLKLYPPGFNLYRCSRGVKRPITQTLTEGEAQELVKGSRLTYEKTVAVIGADGETQNIINYRQYDLKKRNDISADGEVSDKNPC